VDLISALKSMQLKALIALFLVSAVTSSNSNDNDIHRERRKELNRIEQQRAEKNLENVSQEIARVLNERKQVLVNLESEIISTPPGPELEALKVQRSSFIRLEDTYTYESCRLDEQRKQFESLAEYYKNLVEK